MTLRPHGRPFHHLKLTRHGFLPAQVGTTTGGSVAGSET